MINCFELTDKGIKLKDETFALYDDFNSLWKRDNTTGKVQVIKELKYIWYVSDYRSTGVRRGEKGETLHKHAIKFSGLQSNTKIDNIILSCIKTYKAERNGIATTTYINLLKAFNTANAAIELLDDTIAKKLRQLRNSDAETTDSIAKAISSTIKELLTLGTEIPDKINKLEKVKEKAYAEQAQKAKGRSGIEITPSMTGDY